MDLTDTAATVREELDRDVSRGVTQLAELASRYANNRELVYRAVLLKRRLSHAENTPSREQIEEGIAILEALIADQAVPTESGTDTRHAVAEAVRSRALAMKLPNAVVFDCADLGKGYRRGDFALKSISLEARYGEIIGVVGRNGNGKTTLFRLIVGELRPDAGVLRFPAIQPEGGSVRWSRVRQKIAYVPQDLPPWYGSLRSNLHYEAAIHGITGDANYREVDYIVERLGLANELDKRWHELSGGYKLRFALARALVWKPKVLVLDEPLANLDFITQQVVLNDLRHLTDSLRYPLAILVSSQHVHEIEEVSDKLLLLSAGDMKYFGPVESIGTDRRVNRFELAGNLELADLQTALAAPEYYSVYYSGVAFGADNIEGRHGTGCCTSAPPGMQRADHVLPRYQSLREESVAGRWLRSVTPGPAARRARISKPVLPDSPRG